MATSVTFGGITYSIPSENETGWGEQVMAFLVAVAQKTLSTSGGNFLLSGQLNFGSSFGIKLVNITSNSNNVADAGFLRLSNADSIAFRNSANDGNLLLDLSSNKLRFNSSELVDLGSSQTLLLKSIDADSNSISNIQFADNFKSGEVLSDIDDTHSDDSTVGSAKAVKAYVDAEITTTKNEIDTDIVAERTAVATYTNKTFTSPTLNDATLSGTTIIIDSTHLEVTDDLITINKDGNDASAEGAGIEIERTGTDGTFLYEDNLASKFKIGAKGSEVEVANVSSTQEFSNKDLTSSTSTGLDLTTAEVKDHLVLDSVSSDPTTPTTTNEVVIYNKEGSIRQLGTNGVAQGLGGGSGGGGALNLWSDGNAETLVASNFTESGTGTFAISSTSADLINPSRSFKISSASTAFYVETPNIDIPLGYRNRLIGIQFPYRSSDGAEMILDVVDESGTNISSSPALVDSLSSSVGSAQFRYVFQVGDNDIIRLRFRATGTVAEFIWDDVIVTPDPLITLPDTTYAYPTATAANANIFTANIGSGSSPPVTNQSPSTFLTGTTSFENTNYTTTIALTPGVFTEPPTVEFQGSANISLINISTTSLVFATRNSALAGTQSSCKIFLTRTGDDFIEPVLTASTEQKVITYAESLDQINEYTLQVAAVPGAAISNASSEASGWTTSVSGNVVTVTMTGTTFSVTPNIFVKSLGNETVAQVALGSTTSFTYRVNRMFDNVVENQPVNILVTRAGSDIKPPLPTGTFVVHPAATQLIQVDSFLATGSFTYTAPDDVTLIEVEAAAGGGNGGAGTSFSTSGTHNGGIGGASGEYGKRYITVTPETSYSITIGAAASNTVFDVDNTNSQLITWTAGTASTSPPTTNSDFSSEGGGSFTSVTGNSGAFTPVISGKARAASNAAVIFGGATGYAFGGGYGGLNGKARGGVGGGTSSNVNTVITGAGGGGAGWFNGTNAADATAGGPGTAGSGGAGGMIIRSYSEVEVIDHT